MDIYTSKLSPEIVMEGLRKMKKLTFLAVYLEDFYPNQEINKLIPNFVNALGFRYFNWKFKKASLYFPDTLRYLLWDGYPFRSLPETFQATNLVSLKMADNKITQLWEGGERKVLNKLRILDLRNSMFTNLELGFTPNLETLTLEECVDLVELPHTICMLKHLKSLKLDGCVLLEKLHEDLGRLESLENLSLSSTRIRHLPDSICLLKHLKALNLDKCLWLEKLPEDLGRVECLEMLTLCYTKIKHIPDSIGMLKHLKILNLYRCPLFEKLPEDFGRLGCLKDLRLSSTKIKNLPDSICRSKNLESLYLDNCPLLEKLPVDLGLLESLKKLDLEGTCISHLPQSIHLVKGLRVYGSRGLLHSCGFTSLIERYRDSCYVDV